MILEGRYTWKLHKQYGPIIRVDPYEVRINDLDYYEGLYVVGGKRKSEQWA